MRNISKYNTKIMMKIISAFIACLILVLSGFTLFGFRAAAADEGDFDKPVKAGVFSYAGYHMMDETTGNLSGYGIEFLNLVSEYSHIKFEYTNFDKTWQQTQDLLESGEIDVATSASWDEKRAEKFDFSLPMGRKNTIISIRKGDTRFTKGDYKSYEGMTVGQIPGNKQNKILEDFAKEKGFAYNVKEYENDTKLAEALQNEKIDAIISSDLRKTEDEETLDTIGTEDFYAIVKKGNTKLLNEINYAIRQMDRNEGDWQNVLFYKYYGPDYSSELSFTANEQAYMQAVRSGEKSITVTALGNRNPYSYIEDGKLVGIMPDYFDELMKLAELPYTSLAKSELEGEANVILDNTDDVEIKVDSAGHGFNTAYYMTAAMASVTRQNFKGDVKVIAVTPSEGENLVRNFLKGYEFKSYPDGDSAMRAVLNREADAAYVYAYSAQWFINHGHTNSLYYNSMNGMSTSFNMRVSENTDHELVTILNKCIKQMSDDTFNQLASKYTSFTAASMSFMQYMQANPVVPTIVLLIFAIIVGVALALYLRGRWNRRILYATEQLNKQMSEQLAVVQALSREFLDVFAVSEDTETCRIIKLEGFVPEGMEKDSLDEYSYAGFVHNYVYARVHPDDQEEVAEALALDNVKKKLDESNEYLIGYRTVENGEVHFLQSSFIKIAGIQGDFILLGFRNIDEMIRKEREQQEVLADALAQAQYANKAKTTFLNSMSHDIRTPMNAIIGFTALATSHIEDKEKVRDYLGKIMTSGNHLLSLINDVLDMSRIESGKVKIDAKETSLSDIMHDLQTIVQADVKTKKLKLNVETKVTDEIVICDKLRLNQVLLNILSNAIKYTNPGGKVNASVEQKSEAPDGYAAYEFRIKDNGIGMSSEFLKHVFEPFEREQTSTVSGIQGTGLGLAITKNIVDMMGGTIKVESEPGKGSEFIVALCFRVAENRAGAKQPEQNGAEETAFRFDGKKILLVEDNELNQEIAQSILEDEGFVIDTADDGSIAVDKMKKMPAGTYDLILMDVQMPVMNGYEATKAIRALDDPEKASIPIVAMTANAFEEDRKAALDSGMNGFAAKPIEIDELLKTLKSILNK